ncbi:MAG: SDR family oxidoreductase [Actinobacteria bacterium]|nr:SDR family oxidoreductase [Actinomycetota bacterium]
MELDGAVGLVTGGASGIGRAAVARLRDAGARVAVLDVQEPADPVECAIRCDVADELAVVDAVAGVVAQLGPPDVAVLAAGVGGSAPLLRMTVDEWDQVQRINLRGVFLTLRESARAMAAHGRAGAIIAVGSVSGILSDRWMSHYAASKAAVHHLVRVAAAELGTQGIRVNAVAPGTTDTPMFGATERLPGYRDKVAARAALGRVGTADDVAQAIVALATLDWVTGQVVAADGGVMLRSPIDPVESMPEARA